MRNLPNIIVTGTPGTGKSSHCRRLKELLPDMTVVAANDFIKEHDLEDGYDEELQSAMVDEDKLVNLLTADLVTGGQIIDWHVCDIFPENLIDLVVVLRTNNTRLYDRLKERDYASKKLEENLDAEIMEVILSDARDSYASEIVIELHSNEDDDIKSNCDRIKAWKEQWVLDNAEE
ncbi:AAA domain-containing protein [Dipodascopsis uninucleata]